MSVATISGHVVLPHRPDWRQRVEWTRQWDTMIRDSVKGHESRLALRPRGRVGLKFRIVPWNDIEHGLFLDRAREASRLGRGCVPYWGRGCPIGADVSGGATSLPARQEPIWEWDNGDWLWIGHPLPSQWDVWETVQLDRVPGDGTIRLLTGLVNAYPAGTFIHPLIFGATEIGDSELLDDWRGAATVKVEETSVRPVPEPTT